ncbi:MAG: aminoacyl-tRNA hydrolase [Mycoplasmoidaceae bacterium]|nr:MAG: aminoacyl-tRNA hydrolase [Mycoplasmoidaceae bacterium]
MKLVVGLGNFPAKYDKTKHNVGFLAIDSFCKKNGYKLNKVNFNGTFYKGDGFIIAKPLTLMNLSGTFVKEIVEFYKISYEDILIICDDINFKIGDFKIKQSGTSGGQNGLRNILDLLGSDDIKRIRIGIDKNKDMILADYVLSNFTADQLKILKNNVFIKTDVIIDEFINGTGFDAIMNKYNTK